MGKAKMIIALTGVFVLLYSSGNISGSIDQPGDLNSNQTSSKSVQTQSTKTDQKSVQTKSKSTQTVSKTAQTKTKSAQTGTKSVQTKTKAAQTGSKSAQTKSKAAQKSSTPEPAKKIIDPGTVMIGTQAWAIANLNVSTFRNGDTIPEARTNKEWVTAGESGKPAWCYYNNDPATGQKFGKLYNWYAVNDQRGLAPEGWSLASGDDWSKLAFSLGGPEAAGGKLKSSDGWIEGNNGNNESGFAGLPGGYRIENGLFKNSGSIGTWWSSTESKSVSAIDFYLAQSTSLGRSSSPKQRGESVRCLKK